MWSWTEAGSPHFPIDRERGQEQQLFIEGRVVSSASGQSSPAPAHEGGDRGSRRPSWKGSHHSHSPRRGPSASSSAVLGYQGLGCLKSQTPLPSPNKVTPGPKGKTGKAQLHSWAKATSPELPRGQSLPSPGEPTEHRYGLHMISLAPWPERRPIRTTCHPG